MKKSGQKQLYLHLPLYHFPPTPGRICSLMPFFADLGFTSLALEFQDTFPWSFDKRLRSRSAYPEQAIKGILERAEKAGLQCVPFLDCFSSLDFALNERPYRRFRKNETASAILSTDVPGARAFIEELLDDMLALFPDTAYFHLGGSIPAERILNNSSLSGDRFFSDFLEPVCQYLTDEGIRPVFWNTILQGISESVQETFLKLSDFCMIPPVSSGEMKQRIPDRRFWSVCRLTPSLEGEGKIHLSQSNAGEVSLCVSPASSPEDRSTPFILETNLKAIAYAALSLQSPQTDSSEKKVLSFLEASQLLHEYEMKKQVLSEFFEELQSTWKAIRELRELLSLSMLYYDMRKRNVLVLSEKIRDLQERFMAVQRTAHTVSEILSMTVDPLWSETYIRGKLQPVREEIAFIESQSFPLDESL